MKYFLGIDPGLNGALAFFDPFANTLEIIDMPKHSIKVNTKNKNLIDMHQLANIIDVRAADTKMAVIELVGAMPGQGVTSMFGFGFTVGATQMAVIAHCISLSIVSPRTWKKAMGITADKDGARRQASRLLPKHAHLWPLIKHDGRAEAALMALWLAREQSACSADMVEGVI